MKRIGMLVLLLWLCAVASAQTKPAAVAPAPAKGAVEIVPIDKEPSHHLVFENEYVRVFSVEVAPHSETKYHQHDRDYVWVALGDSDVESVRVGEQPVHIQPKDGETQFSKAKFAHKAVNLSDKPFRNVTIELKKEGLDGIAGMGCNVSANGLESCDGFYKISTMPTPIRRMSFHVAAGGPVNSDLALADFGLLVFLNDGILMDKDGHQKTVSSGTFDPVVAETKRNYRSIGGTVLTYVLLSFPYPRMDNKDNNIDKHTWM